MLTELLGANTNTAQHTSMTAFHTNSATMQIISVTPYRVEMELLRVRLFEHSSVVDVFVVTESTLTHSGNSKELHLDENICEVLAPFLPGINLVHVIINNTAKMSVWDREAYGRVSCTMCQLKS